jgi:hypothetical protein
MPVSCECCVLSGRVLCDELVPSRGVLPTVVCLKCVIMKPRRNEETQAHIGLSSHRKEKEITTLISCFILLLALSASAV